MTDHTGATRQATHGLIDLGHRRMPLAGGPTIYPARERIRDFTEDSL